jgi:hypothetical protein
MLFYTDRFDRRLSLFCLLSARFSRRTRILTHIETIGDECMVPVPNVHMTSYEYTLPNRSEVGLGTYLLLTVC